jgi:hypothetical protein
MRQRDGENLRHGDFETTRQGNHTDRKFLCLKKKGGVMKYCVIMVLLAGMLFGQVLYEEYFTSGSAQLQWDPWVEFSHMDVVNDPTTPGGDSWAGSVYNDSAPIGAMYAGDYALDDYMVEAWIFTEVAAAMGPYNGVCIRIDTATNSMYQIVSDFDSDARLMLRHIIGATPTVIRAWTSAEIPGGLPAMSSWHKLGLRIKADSIWAYYDDSLLVDCPFMDSQVANGYFGIYFFSIMGGSTKCDDIIASGLTGINEHNSQTMDGFSLYPNPFRHFTDIRYPISDYRTHLKIFDASGRLVKDLGLSSAVGDQSSVRWDGCDTAGNSLAPGVYFISDDTGERMAKVIKID